MNTLYIDFDSMLDDGLTDYERSQRQDEDLKDFILLYKEKR